MKTIKMNTTSLKKFGVHETGVAPYDGWTGNQNQNLYGKDLSRAIRADLQKVLCEGSNPLKKSDISVRLGRGGYATSLYITIKADRHSSLIATDEEIRERVIDNMRHGERCWVGATFNIYCDSYRAMSDEEQRQIENDTADAVLATIKGYIHINQYHIDREEVLSDFGKEVFRACEQVVDGYNSDHSDIMSDYFDRGIYGNYTLEIRQTKGTTMKTIKMNTNDLLIIDPCYIKGVRFDALKHIKTLYEGDDGSVEVRFDGKPLDTIGVDSGRVWVLQAEFPVEVEIDSGFSGEIYRENLTGKPLRQDTIEKYSAIYLGF